MEISSEEKIRIAKLPYKLHAHLTDVLDAFKYSVLEKNFSRVIIFDGKSGYGKSTLMSQVGSYLDPTFNISKVCFIPQDFLDTLANAKKGDFICLDEAMLLSNRSMMSSLNRTMVIAMSMIRSKNIFVGFCINSCFDLDKNLILHRADLLLHVYSESLTERGKFMSFYRANDGVDRIKKLYLMGKKFYDYSSPRSNFNTTFSSKLMLDEEKYEEKKQYGINIFLKGDQSDSGGFKIKRSRDNCIRYLKEKSDLTIDQIAEICGISSRSVYRILEMEEKT